MEIKRIAANEVKLFIRQFRIILKPGFWKSKIRILFSSLCNSEVGGVLIDSKYIGPIYMLLVNMKSTIYCLTLTFLFIFNSSRSFAQQKVFQHTVNWAGGRPALYYFPSNTEGQFALVLVSADSIKTLLITKSFKIRARFTVPGPVDWEDFSGGVVRNDSILLFLRNATHMHTYAYAMNTGTISESSIQFNPRHERDLLGINTGTRHLYISFSKENTALVAYAFDNTGSYKRTEYPLGEKFSIKTKDAGVINAIDIPDAQFLQKKNKFYARGDTLVFIADRPGKSSTILEIDLNSGSSFTRNLNASIVSDADASTSFLLGKKHYLLQASKEELSVTIHDFYSGKELQKFSAKQDESISFANTPVTITGGDRFGIMGEYRQVDKAKVFLNKLAAGDALIGAMESDSGFHIVTVGVTKTFRNVNGGGMFSPDGTYRPVSTYNKQWDRVASFKMLVDPVTNKQAAGDLNFDLFARIDQYKTGLSSTDEGEALLRLGGIPYLVYYDRDAKKLCIVKM